MVRQPGVLSIVRTAVVRAPASARTVLWWVVLGSVGMLALQAWDVRGRWDAAGTAEFLSVAAGVTGVLLLALVSAIGAGSAAFSAAEDDDLRPVLIALPTVAFIAGALIAAAAAFTATRGLLGLHQLRLGPAFALLIMAFALAWRTVNDTTRVLFDRAQRRGAQVAEARAALADARVAALQARMQPHFLFNALNTVAGLARTDPAAAEATVEDLCAILRASLTGDGRPTRPLADEIAIARAYVAVEQRRLGARLAVTWNCADDAGAVLVPAWSVQPLVENAIRYGVAPRIDGGAVIVDAHRDGITVTVRVRDEGDGFARGWKEGTGLGSLRERLAFLYGDRASLTVRSDPGGDVAMTVPIRIDT
jgi:two-component system sensor histidine kinase AlgZ